MNKKWYIIGLILGLIMAFIITIIVLERIIVSERDYYIEKIEQQEKQLYCIEVICDGFSNRVYNSTGCFCNNNIPL